MLRIYLFILFAFGLAACSDFPQFDDVASEKIRTDPFAEFQLSDNFSEIAEEFDTAELNAEKKRLAKRAKRLNKRAKRLRRPVISRYDRRRLNAALERYNR